MRIETFTSDIEAFILRLDARTYAKTMRGLDLLRERGYRLGMPDSKSLGKGLFELRIIGYTQVRILYCFHNDAIWLLNVFIKKTGKIPKREMELAIERERLLV